MKENRSAGPWHIEESKYSEHIYIYADEDEFEKNSLHVCNIKKELNANWRSDLRLISAAPDLLKVAINLLDAVVTQCDYGKGSATDQWVIEAKAAIEKATTNAHDRA